VLGRPCIQLKGKRDTQTCQTPSAKNLGQKRDLEPPPLLTLLGVLSGVREKQQTGRERGSAKRLLVLVLVLALVVRPKPTRMLSVVPEAFFQGPSQVTSQVLQGLLEHQFSSVLLRTLKLSSLSLSLSFL